MTVLKPAVRLTELPSGSSAQEVRQVIARDGGVILKGLFAKEVDALNAELDEHVAKRKMGTKGSELVQEVAGRRTKRLTRLVTTSSVFREQMLDHDILLSYIDVLLDASCDTYWMSTSQVIELQPGEKAQFLHRDADNYPIFRQYNSAAPEVMCNCLVALSDYTEEMGATRVIPGSNTWEDFQRPVTHADTIPAVMEKGDALLFSGKLLHGGGANNSDKPRRALAIAFCPGWLVPEEAHQFVIPMDIVKTLSPRAQQMLGFRSFHNTKLQGGSLWLVDFEELADDLKLDG